MEDKRLAEIYDDLSPADLSIGTYFVTEDGRFIKCSPEARRIQVVF